MSEPIQDAEAAQHERAVALAKRVIAGDKLTAAEKNELAGRPTPEMLKQKTRLVQAKKRSHAAKMSERWGCRLPRMYALIQEGVPVEDDAAMVKWYATLSPRAQSAMSPAFRGKLMEVRTRLDGGSPEAASGPDQDEEAFAKIYKPNANDDKDNLAMMKREAALQLFRAQQARRRRDAGTEAEALKHYARLSGVVHDCETRALRAGRDMGESYSAADVDRLGKALAFWLMNGADALVAQMVPVLVNLLAEGRVDRESVRQAVEPMLMDERVAVPLVRAVKSDAPIALPDRFVEAVRAGLAAVAEDGEAEFARLYARPLPKTESVEAVAVA